MTVNEKREKLNTYCEDRDCESCKLAVGGWINELDTKCPHFGISPESDLDRALQIINENDPVNRPSHYTDGKIEVIDFIEDKKLGFCLGNAVKYISRAGKKDPTKEIEDLNKAKWYIERRIKELQEVN
jgi:hypothetical protein